MSKGRIGELKGDYPPCKIPTADLFANEAYFHLLLLTYIFVNWFKPLCRPPDRKRPRFKPCSSESC